MKYLAKPWPFSLQHFSDYNLFQVTELDRITGNLTDATATATYSVFVTDSNDNAPTFDKEIYTETVIEPINNRITQIPGFRMICNDPDEVYH